jgi:hypothetical protein
LTSGPGLSAICAHADAAIKSRNGTKAIFIFTGMLLAKTLLTPLEPSEPALLSPVGFVSLAR